MNIKFSTTHYLYFIVVCILVAGFFSTKGVAMTSVLGREEKVFLFSAVDGRLTFKDRPAAGAKITRTVSWKDNVLESDIYYANDLGEFSMPAKTSIIKKSPLGQFVVHQDIHVSFSNAEFHIWRMGKLSEAEYGEFNNQPKNFRCELTDEMVRVKAGRGILGTSCKWD